MFKMFLEYTKLYCIFNHLKTSHKTPKIKFIFISSEEYVHTKMKMNENANAGEEIEQPGPSLPTEM